MPSHSPRRSDEWEDHALHVLRSAAALEAQLDSALRSVDLTTDRWRALLFVSRDPGSSMADLIEALAVPPTSATRIVDALVECGALFRSAHPQDRRRVTLHLSAQGKQLIRRARAALETARIPVDTPARSASPR